MIDEQLLKFLETYITESRRVRFQEVLKERTKHFTVATEDVYQLHNTSAVIRSCDVFGIQEVHVVEEQNAKQIDREIAMGAQKWVDIHRYHSVKSCIQDMRSKGYQIVATTPHQDDCLLQDFDVTKKSCFFFGREQLGLSQEVLNEADVYLKIPMVGFTESLNISVSAAIILQQVTIQLKQSQIPWQLSENEILEKRLDWTKKSLKSLEKLMTYYEQNKHELTLKNNEI